jgi:triosephosphate isomerase
MAGNWKMHGSLAGVKKLINGIKQGIQQNIAFSEIEILVLPSYVHLLFVRDLIASSSLLLGAQNSYTGREGAFTGEVSASMLVELGCQYVLVGHSERRSIFHESHSLIAAKFQAVLDAGLKPILCVGETQGERESGETEAVLRSQLESVIHLTGIDAFQQAVIAYEPVWAIGTGLTATPEQAQAAHTYIRELIKQNKVDIAGTIRILYGGSMKAENAASLLAMPDIDGGLIGGASLDASSFVKICAAGLVKLER